MMEMITDSGDERMIMDLKCPYCGSEALDMGSPDEEWWGNDMISKWYVTCDHGHRFVVSDVNRLTSRLVAKDDKELDVLIKKEEEEEMI